MVLLLRSREPTTQRSTTIQQNATKAFMNRRGFIMDAFPIISILFIMGVLFVIALLFLSNIDAAMQDQPDLNARRMATTMNEDAAWALDFIFIMALFAFPLGSMILAFMNNIPPFFFFASLGVLLLVVIIGGAFADSWTTANTDTIFRVQSERMPMSFFVLSHFGVYALFVIIIISAGTYVKLKNSYM